MAKNIEIQYSSFDEDGAILGSAAYVLYDFFAHRYAY
jgi:hypothetical protein